MRFCVIVIPIINSEFWLALPMEVGLVGIPWSLCVLCLLFCCFACTFTT